MCDYSLSSYWEKRYEKEPETFEWYQNYANLKPFIFQYITKDQPAAVLHVGCGNSRIGEGLYRDGVTHVVNIDLCRTIIDIMNNKHKLLSEMKYLTMDVRHLKFDEMSFHVVLDKGTLDCIVCGENAKFEVNSMLSEIYRVLKNDGVYICISYGTPATRVSYFNLISGWNLEQTIPVEKPKQAYEVDATNQFHYIYVLRKSQTQPQ